MSFKIEENIIKVSKNCDKCEHVKVCKFHSKMKALCNSNEFYGMTRYSEGNNSLMAFNLNASCQYFKLNYVIPEDGSVNLDIDEDIIREIVNLERPKEGLSRWCVEIEKNNVEFYMGNVEKVNVKITDLLSKYSFVKK